MKQLIIVFLILGFASIAQADLFDKVVKKASKPFEDMYQGASRDAAALNRDRQSSKDCGIGFTKDSEGETNIGIKCKGNTQLDRAFNPASGDNDGPGTTRNSEDVSPW